MIGLTRRELLQKGLLVAGGLGLPRTASATPFNEPLGFVLHALRAQAAKDLAGTLLKAAALGYEDVELVSFRGYSGPGARDGFGPLAPTPPSDVKQIILDAGLKSTSCHFKYVELEGDRLNESIAWAKAVGVTYLTASELPAATSMGEWTTRFASLNRIGARLRSDGQRLGLHTQADLWKEVDGKLVLDAMLEAVDASHCEMELDLSSTQVSGIDAAGYLAKHPGRFFAIHLRDARTPQRPGYLPSVPLGQGDLDLRSILQAARTARVASFVVDMQVQAPMDPLGALKQSAAYLRALDV